MAPTLRPKATCLAAGPVIQATIPEVSPQQTPDGHVQDLLNSSQVQAQPQSQNLILVQVDAVRNQLQPPPPPDLTIHADAVQQLVQLLQRQEMVNQARTFRFTQLEVEVAELRGRHIADQGSPESKSPESRNLARRRQPRTPPGPGNYHRSPSRNDGGSSSPRPHTSWVSSSPRRRSRSQEV